MSATFDWIIQNAFDLISTIGIIASLLFTAASYRTDNRSRRLSNLILLTSQHRDIWKEFIQNPALKRVLDPFALTKSTPVTESETQFVVLLLLHLHTWFKALQIEDVCEAGNLSLDIQTFFSLPIPRKVWENRRNFYGVEFARFVDENLNLI